MRRSTSSSLQRRPFLGLQRLLTQHCHDGIELLYRRQLWCNELDAERFPSSVVVDAKPTARIFGSDCRGSNRSGRVQVGRDGLALPESHFEVAMLHRVETERLPY